MWDELQTWCRTHCEEFINRHRFADFLRERSAVDKESNGVREWRGVGLAREQP